MNSKTKIVVVGGGAGGLELVMRLCHLSKKIPLEITLIDRQLKHLWKPLLHEIAAGTFSSYHDEVNYISYAYQKGFTFLQGGLKEINQQKKWINLEPFSEQKIFYDILVIAIGSQVNDFNIPGVKDYCLFLDNISTAEAFHQKLINHIINVQRGREDKIKISIVGGGATGVELAAELSYALSHALKYLNKKETPSHPLFEITLIESGTRLLNMMPERISNNVAKYLLKNNINILTDTKIVKATPQGLETTDKRLIDSSLTVWAAGVKVNNSFITHSLELNAINQFIVRDTLQVSRDTHIFAFGDCASCPQIDKKGNLGFVPPRAQAAHQQANFLAKSIRNLILKKPLPVYHYKDYGSLISLSHSHTVGVLMGRIVKNFFIEGSLARLTYWLLYKKHLLIVKGARFIILSCFIDFLLRKKRPEVKLH
ncbi:MAG: NAD(P)/FAD-dependent oxidoreductase [Legionella sp.]|nr:NAD(P)/FAD-dependent oxidoreductase [Legionella sp.]